MVGTEPVEGAAGLVDGCRCPDPRCGRQISHQRSVIVAERSALPSVASTVTRWCRVPPRSSHQGSAASVTGSTARSSRRLLPGDTARELVHVVVPRSRPVRTQSNARDRASRLGWSSRTTRGLVLVPVLVVRMRSSGIGVHVGT